MIHQFTFQPPTGDGGEGLVDLYLANNVFNSDNDFELGDGVTVIDDETPETCQADEPTGSAAAVPYPGPFTQMPEPAGDAASPETPTAASAAGDGVAGLAYTGTTTTTLAYLAVGLIGFRRPTRTGWPTPQLNHVPGPPDMLLTPAPRTSAWTVVRGPVNRGPE